MTSHILLILGIILALSAVLTLIHMILRQLRSRVVIRKVVSGVPSWDIATIKHRDGQVAEAYLPKGGDRIVGRVSIEKEGDKAVVQLLQSSVDDTNPVFRRCGFICEDGFIYSQPKKEGLASKVGYLACPSKPDNPSLKGERTWRTLWLHSYLNVYQLNSDYSFEDEEVLEDLVDMEPAVDPIPAVSGVVEEEGPETPVADAIEDVAAVAGEQVNALVDQIESRVSEVVEAKPEEDELPPVKKNVSKLSDKATLIAQCDTQGRMLPPMGAITTESRAGAYALFAIQEPQQQFDEYYSEAKDGWRDTALLAALVYTVLYVLYYLVNTSILQRPLVGYFGWAIPVLYGFYYVIWALLRSIKIERKESGHSFQPQLDLLNKFVGQRGVDIWVILIGSTAMALTPYFFHMDFIPMLMALVTGFTINKTIRSNGEPWKIYKSYSEMEEDSEIEYGELDTNQPPSGDITCNYDWDLDYEGLPLHGNLSIRFDADQIREERQNNPFFSQNPIKPTDIVRQQFEMLCRRRDYMERMRYLSKYIMETASRADLAEHVKLQFALDFIQEPNIRFVRDKDSERIQFALQYMRMPDETLFDKEGDYDCKAFFATMLFHSMGYDVIFLYSTKHDHYAVAVEERYHWTDVIWQEVQGKYVIPYEGKNYVLCETGADRFKVGEMLAGIEVKDFDFQELFLHRTPGVDYEDTEYKSYDWDFDGEEGNVSVHSMVIIGFNTHFISDLRRRNPFRDPEKKERPLIQNVAEMVRLLRSDPKYTMNLMEVVKDIREKFPDSDLSRLQFALDFVQEPNIRFCQDSRSASILFTKGYVRFPDETLFDKEGDSDCKSFLAAMLFSMLGSDTLFMYDTKKDFTAIAVESTPSLVSQISHLDRDKAVIIHNGREYLFCDTTREGLRIGRIAAGLTKTDFDSILEIKKINE